MNCGALSGNKTERTCLIADLGLLGVTDTERFMSAAAEFRLRNECPDIVFFLVHPKTVALGLRDRRCEIPKDLLVTRRRLEEEGIALTRSVRGGGITYHWPGQVVCYPVLALGPGERDLPGFMTKLEQVGMQSLARFGLAAMRRRDSASHVGLWLDGKKIVSMGVRVSNWITSFGFALNLEGDHSQSRYVRPCGLEGVELTTVQEALGHAPPRQWLMETICDCFGTVFGRIPKKMPDDLFAGICSLAHSKDVMRTGSG
ncbi:MAG TPA: lipoyl(octanoyl) transferase LipB [Desulfomonilaceae bacterium]|nr:lipoyl(octanoyl) transferase LipB [Desulfomonilaceae bacterium]